MQLAEISIRRPVFATVLSLLVLLVGAVSFTRLTVREQDAFWSGNAVRCYGLNVQALTD